MLPIEVQGVYWVLQDWHRRAIEICSASSLDWQFCLPLQRQFSEGGTSDLLA